MKITQEQVAVAYQKYGHLVLRRCLFVLRDPVLAEDAMQDVYVRLMKYGDGYLKADVPLRWLYQVANRACFDLLKKDKKRPRSDEDAVAQLSISDSTEARTADRQIVMALLGRFDTKTQQVAVLHYVEDLPQERIAQITGWSRQTVNKKLKTIKARAAVLRTSLGVVP